MPIGGIPSLYNGEAIQPNLSYVDSMVWNTNGQLPPGDVIGEMFLPDVSGTAGEMSVGLTTNIQGDQYNQIYNSYETIQLLDLEVHGRSGLGSAALAPGPSLVPTPLPASDQLDLSFGLGLELGGSVGEADLQATSESEEATVNFSPGPFEVQFLSTASSSSGCSGSGSQQTEQRKPKKKEESGSCDECHRSFSRRSDVRRHKITAHKKEAHGCPLCPIKCSRKDALLRHIRDQH